MWKHCEFRLLITNDIINEFNKMASRASCVSDGRWHAQPQHKTCLTYH